MNWLIAQLKYRSKALVVAVAGLAATAAVSFLTASGTEKAIISMIPAQYQVIGTLLVGAVITGIVHAIPLGSKPATATDAPPATELADSPATTAISTINTH